MGPVPTKSDTGIRGVLEKIPPIIKIREEWPEDADEIFRIHEKAFSRREETNLVKTLCSNDFPRLSLLALREKQSVGHILFTQAWIGEGYVVALKQRHQVAMVCGVGLMDSCQRALLG